MKISVEISMYPLADQYVPAIRQFIDQLAGSAGVEVITNTMSTQLFGDLDAVMDALREGLGRAFDANGKAVFVMKIINSNLRPE